MAIITFSPLIDEIAGILGSCLFSTSDGSSNMKSYSRYSNASAAGGTGQNVSYKINMRSHRYYDPATRLAWSLVRTNINPWYLFMRSFENNYHMNSDTLHNGYSNARNR